MIRKTPTENISANLPRREPAAGRISREHATAASHAVARSAGNISARWYALSARIPCRPKTNPLAVPRAAKSPTKPSVKTQAERADAPGANH